MRYEDIGVMFGQAAGLDFSKDVFHQVALVSAGTHRNGVMVTIPTRHIYINCLSTDSVGLVVGSRWLLAYMK